MAKSRITNNQVLDSDFATQEELDLVQTRIDNLFPSDITPTEVNGYSAEIGTALQFARADHKHNLVFASPNSISYQNIEGTSVFAARADHEHAIALDGETIAFSNTISRASNIPALVGTSPNYLLFVGLSPGLYYFNYGLVAACSSTTKIGYFSIYVNTTEQEAARRYFRISNANEQTTITASILVRLNNISDVGVYWWSQQTSTLTAYHRSFSYIRLA